MKFFERMYSFFLPMYFYVASMPLLSMFVVSMVHMIVMMIKAGNCIVVVHKNTSGWCDAQIFVRT